MMIDHRFLLTVLAMILMLPTCTVCGTMFQNEYQSIPKDNIHYQEGLNTQSLDSHIGYNSQKNGHTNGHGEEVDNIPKARRLVLDLLIRTLAQEARARNERPNFLNNQDTEGEDEYRLEDFTKSVQASKGTQQEKKASGTKADGPPKQGKKSKAAIRNGNTITSKRGNRPSLSIVSPLDVLSQRLMLEMARRKMKQSRHQITANAEFLKTLGKRNLFIHKNM
ncbi:uncharacterized protein LOC111087796 [Limulus polyphemus]|uniref:Uncharacterized protein LOC111087796 n=1 Tax=Limulus polyphemus TaxID=6850 RepID=A0ABM1T6C7_LIMPO|nr:uncharacterized protein LOC111087796 [Limulus polyphemus]